MTVSGLHIELLVNDEAGEPEMRRISVAFERAGDEIGDFGKHVFPKLPAIFETEARRQFDGEGAGPTGGWAALSPEYAQWKDQHYPGMPTLRRTNSLYEALTNSSSAHAERSDQGSDFVYGTTGLEYPSHLQLGTKWMPARPPLDFSDDFERDLTHVLSEAVRDAVKAAGADEFSETT